MALPSTSNSQLLFTSTPPAWELGVEMTQAHQTRLFTSRSGLEQRQQSRQRSQIKINYSCYFSHAARVEREERSRAEIVSPVVVPIWTEQAYVASMLANAVTIDRTATPDWFEVGDYLYLTNGTQGQFRLITGYGVSLQVIQLEPIDPAVIFNAGAAVIPCRICTRGGGMFELSEPNDFSLREEIIYDTL
jgi:hypothetical protein